MPIQFYSLSVVSFLEIRVPGRRNKPRGFSISGFLEVS